MAGPTAAGGVYDARTINLQSHSRTLIVQIWDVRKIAQGRKDIGIRKSPEYHAPEYHAQSVSSRANGIIADAYNMRNTEKRP